jgi:hypothetical protein
MDVEPTFLSLCNYYVASNIHGTVHRNMTRRKSLTRSTQLWNFYYSTYVSSLTCFEHYVAHHQEP